jgi:hypothetical protein
LLLSPAPTSSILEKDAFYSSGKHIEVRGSFVLLFPLYIDDYLLFAMHFALLASGRSESINNVVIS